MPTILREQNQILLLKSEAASYGVDSTPNGANAIKCSSVSVKTNFDYEVRSNITGFLGDQGSIVTGSSVDVEFEIELSTSNVAGTAPAYAAALLACGLSEVIVASTSVTYAPIDANFDSVTVYWRVNGLQYAVTGCRGNVSIDMNNKAIPKLKFTMKGLYTLPTDASASPATIDFSAVNNPVGVMSDNVFSLSAYAETFEMKTFMVDVGNNIVHTNVINANDVQITGRNGKASISGRTSREQVISLMTKAENNDFGAVEMTLGKTAGNTVQVNVPQVQMSSTPSLSWSDTMADIQLEMTIVPATANSDLTLVYK